MPSVEVVLMPKYLGDSPLKAKTVVVFDVLRATTTIIAALAAGIRTVRAFAELEEAKAAARANPGVILCGEVNALPAPGVDMGNSPGQFGPEHAGRDVFLSTTNGTKALNAAKSAAALFAGALVNASATAKAAASTNQDVLLLGSGTNGDIAMEDTIGAGAVCDHLLSSGKYSLANDTARMSHRLFLASRDELPSVLRDCQGGRNITKVGLEADIDFAARLDVFNIAAVVDRNNLVIQRWS
ncbi:MAG TPA: 2-phosphosulfolactate phosphatase [Tepidisphaeraceae bacterium]|jgi:2-phosphosulfolactate phosphatase